MKAMRDKTGSRPIRRGSLMIKFAYGISITAVGVIASYYGLLGSGEGRSTIQGIAADQTVRWTVQHQDLTISALAAGELKTKNMVTVRNDADSSLKITWIVPEGTMVKKGDKLVELDNSDLTERYLQQKIKVTESNQEVQKAKDDLAIAKQTLETATLASRNAVTIAQLALEKYKQGDFISKKEEQEAMVFIAQEESKQAQNALGWTEKLHEKDYVTKTDLERDQLAVQKTEVQVNSSKRRLVLLEKYDYQMELTQFGTTLGEAEGKLKEVELTGESDLNSRKATMKASGEKAELERITLENLKRQLEATVILAPEDGLVAYSKERSRRGSSDSVLQVGTTLSPRQRIIDLPDFSTWIIEARIHESMIQRIKLGQPAFITLDAMGDKLLQGTVSKIGVLPDSSNWMRDVQEYLVEIDLSEGSTAFKPGMSGKIDIIIKDIKNALVVPISAVQSQDGKPVVWIIEETGSRMQEVETGSNNGRMVEIVSGVVEGQVILMDKSLTGSSALGPRPSEKASSQQRESAREMAEDAEKSQQRSPRSQRGGPSGRDGYRPAGESNERRGGQDGRRGNRGNRGNFDPSSMTPEQRERMRKRLEERMESMTPEQRAETEKRIQQFSNP